MTQSQNSLAEATLQSEQTDTWLSAYLFHAGSFEDLLRSAVIPFLQTLEERSLIGRYFFIRYWENGPHIRLRIKSSESNIAIIQPFLKNWFEEHFANSSPDSTVTFVAYEPEIDRYGGPDGILVAEDLFQLSSSAVLDIIKDNVDWSYTDALTNAIILHLAFTHSMRMNTADAVSFFDAVHRNWMSRAEAIINGSSSEKPALQAFAESFKKQEGALYPFVRDLWEGLQQGESFDEPWLNRWIEGTNEIYESLCSLKQKGRLNQATYAMPTKNMFRHYLHSHYYMLDSYIHMTNNRLGVSNHDEGYLGFLISKCMERILSESKSS